MWHGQYVTTREDRFIPFSLSTFSVPNFTPATGIIEASTNFFRGISYLITLARFYRGNFHPGLILIIRLQRSYFAYRKTRYCERSLSHFDR